VLFAVACSAFFDAKKLSCSGAGEKAGNVHQRRILGVIPHMSLDCPCGVTSSRLLKEYDQLLYGGERCLGFEVNAPPKAAIQDLLQLSHLFLNRFKL
jgi:hypothetical protein